MLTSVTKNVSFNLGYFKYFWDKHWELLANSSLWRSWTDSQLSLSWFTAHKAIDMSEMLLGIRSSSPAAFCKKKYVTWFSFFVKPLVLKHATAILKRILSLVFSCEKAKAATSEKSVLKDFANFTRKHLCRSLLWPATLSKRDSHTGVFLWNLWNF